EVYKIRVQTIEPLRGTFSAGSRISFHVVSVVRERGRLTRIVRPYGRAEVAVSWTVVKERPFVPATPAPRPRPNRSTHLVTIGLVAVPATDDAVGSA
ncbi:hypothetical protein, partial [Methylobacterium platani]